MSVWKIFVLSDNLTIVQLHTTCVENIFVCLIFVVFDEYEKFLTTKVLRITVIYFSFSPNELHVCQF